MKRILLASLLGAAAFGGFAQTGSEAEAPRIYRATPERINDLVHTKLEAGFDYAKQQLNGTVWLPRRPQGAPPASLTLDAKGMDIKDVSIVKGGKNS